MFSSIAHSFIHSPSLDPPASHSSVARSLALSLVLTFAILPSSCSSVSSSCFVSLPLFASFLGLAVAGRPNFWWLLGPNTGLGHSSVVFMAECQAAYIVEALLQLQAQGASRVEVKPHVLAQYNATLQPLLADKAWTVGGCSTWYAQKCDAPVSLLIGSSSVLSSFGAVVCFGLWCHSLFPSCLCCIGAVVVFGCVIVPPPAGTATP